MRVKKSEYTVSEVAYICRFFDHDGPSRLGLSLNRSSSTIAEMVKELKVSGEFEFYKKLWEKLFEKGVGA